MKDLLRRIIVILLAIGLCITSVPLTAFADGEQNEATIIDDNGVPLQDYSDQDSQEPEGGAGQEPEGATTDGSGSDSGTGNEGGEGTSAPETDPTSAPAEATSPVEQESTDPPTEELPPTQAPPAETPEPTSETPSTSQPVTEIPEGTSESPVTQPTTEQPATTQETTSSEEAATKSFFSYEDPEIIVEVTLDEEAALPAETVFVVRQIFENSIVESERNTYLWSEELLDKYLEKEEIAAVNTFFYDMYFELDGKKIRPNKEFKVEIEYKKDKVLDEEANADNVRIYHIDDNDLLNEPEVVDTKAKLEVNEFGSVTTAEFQIKRYLYTPLMISMIESKEAHEERLAREEAEGKKTETKSLIYMENPTEEETSSEDGEKKLITDEDTEGNEDETEEEEPVPTRSYYANWSGDVSATIILSNPAQIPDTAEVVVTPVTPDAEDYNYDAYIEALNSSDESITYTAENTLLYDIKFVDTILDENGEVLEEIEYEPEEGTVQVILKFKNNQLSNEINAEDNQNVTVNHLVTDVEVDTTDISAEDISVVGVEADVQLSGTDTVTFNTESFSVYAFSYTVDFHWEVNGKEYQFTIPGGGSVSFSKLMEIIGAAYKDDPEDMEDVQVTEEENTEEVQSEEKENSEENDAQAFSGVLTLDDILVSEETKEFVAEVEKVEFSKPELVWIGKVDAESTVGALKETNKLAVEYSEELTDSQIEEINAQIVESGDWALISVQPFTSEESLTVTMKDGEVFTIRVTDAQIHTYVISDSGDTYKITVTYNDTAGIPADAELRVHQLTPEDDRYQDDIDRSNDALLAKYDEETTNPLLFDIKIFANDEEIEPIEGSLVSVEIMLATDTESESQDEEGDAETEAADAPEDDYMGEDEETAENDDAVESEDSVEGEAEESYILIDGVEYTLEPGEIDPDETKVVHLTDDGEAVVIEELNSMVDEDNNLVLNFETESFSDYAVYDVSNLYNLRNLPSTIYIGDEIYMRNCSNMWVTDIGNLVTETKYPEGNSDYKSVRAIKTGTFRICHQNDWNGGNPDWSKCKVITILPARTGTTPPSTIPTVSNASIGLTLNLFDYDEQNDTTDGFLDNRFNNRDFGTAALGAFTNYGINSGHSLKFWGSGIDNDSEGRQNMFNWYDPVTGIVNTNLAGGVGGYPTLTNDSTSLEYLFAPSDGPYKKAYPNADGLFKKDGDYYVYDSDQNYAWYNPSTNRFEVYNGTYNQKSRVSNGEAAGEPTYPLNEKAIGFFPFHRWDDQYDLFVNWNKNLDHHFGLSMSVQFSLPKNPKAVVDTAGNPIIFDFSGDDDMWVFIDGKLAMDIGGIHQPVSGTINFMEQTVTVAGQQQNFDFSGLYDGELHTLQVFYIERGGCDSNCKIKFNLTQYGDVEFSKEDKDNTSDKLGGAIFGLYKDEACTQPLLEKLNTGIFRAFIAQSDADGRVKFEDVPLGNYYMKEIKAPDGYPLNNTVYPVSIYLENGSLIKVKVRVDNVDYYSPNVQITNKKPDPITLGLNKEWKDQNGITIPAPANTSAMFELKRIKTYETINSETQLEGEGRDVSHLVVGWSHNGKTHIHKEFDLISGSTATVSWKDASGNIVSESITMPAAGQTVYKYIVDNSENGDAIKQIQVTGSQFIGNSGGGLIRNITTISEPDTGFQYTGDNVTNNRVTLPINGTENPWRYDFMNLPLIGKDGNTVYNYTYYIEEISSNSPEGTTVIYKDLSGNVINSASDAETSVSGTQTITNKVDLGALELTKNITVTTGDGQTQPMTDPNQWVNGTVRFTIDGVDTQGSFTKGIHHNVEITYAAGKITGYKIDTTQTPVDPAVTGTTYSILLNNLVPGDYVIKETGSSNMTLTGITGGKNDASLTAKTITVTVTHGKNTAETLENTAKATFTNNLKTINVPATKTWADLNNGTTHPTIYFRLFYHTDNGEVAVDGVKLKSLPNGTTTVTWENMPKYDQNGQEYNYLVKEYIQKDGGEFTEDDVSYTEAAPNGYVASEEGLSVTNTESDKYDPRTSYTGRKVWVDTANNGATRPDNLIVTLMIDKTGDGPSPDDEVAMHNPVWSKPAGSNEWTYTFNNLPVYDANWNIIHYYAVETPMNSYTQDDAVFTNTKYDYNNKYTAYHIDKDGTYSVSTDISFLPFIAVQTGNNNHYGSYYHIWTIRATTDDEKALLVQIFNNEIGGNNITVNNTRFVSGLPVSNGTNGVEFLYKNCKISISKSSGDELKIEVKGQSHTVHIIAGTLKYDYSAGSTDLQNTLKTEDYDVQKTWGNGQAPPEGAEVQFTLTATIPGISTDENPNPDPISVDLNTLGITKSVITLNGGQKEGEEYTGDDTTEAPWKYSWKNLPQYDKNGNKITYSAAETSYKIDGENINITSEGLVPPTTSEGIYELITTNRIPTEDISTHKYWPAGQTVPENTQITLTITAEVEGGATPRGVTVIPATITLDGKVTLGDDDEVETTSTLWQYTWKDLPKYDKDGKKITYTVAETGYQIGEISYPELFATANEQAYDGVDFSFTNELPGTRITVEKTWSNNGGSWPEGVSVIMTLKGSAPTGENGEMQELKTLVLPDIKVEEENVHQTAKYALKGDETSHTWYDLPMYTREGLPITYTVDETGMTYTPEEGEEPIPILNWAQAFTVNEIEDQENHKVTIDNTPLETEISLTKVWTLNGQPKPMNNGAAIEFKLYRTDKEGELTLSEDCYAANKGDPTLNKILYVGSDENPEWQIVTISKLPKYVLKLETTDEGTRAYYTDVAYYAVETVDQDVMVNTRISYTLSPTNAAANSGADEDGEGGGNTGTTISNETTDPTQSAIGTGTITIYNRETSVDINVLKVDATDNEKTLPDAEFQILKWSEDSHDYRVYNLETQDYAAEGEEAESKRATGTEGTLVFEGLLDGKYKIIETKAPDGYNTITGNDIFFSIDDGTVTWTDEQGNTIDTKNKPDQIEYEDLTFTVGNTPGAALPLTGGPGTKLLYLIGILLIGLAGAGLVMKRRRKGQSK